MSNRARFKKPPFRGGYRKTNVRSDSVVNEIENAGNEVDEIPLDADSALTESNEVRFLRAKASEVSDRRYGFEAFVGPGETSGWLYNMHPTDMLDDAKRLVSAVDFYFIRGDGSRFKVTRSYLPYFFISVRGGAAAERDVTTYLSRKYSGRISTIDTVTKNDLDLPNHLVGLKASYLKILFNSVDELVRVRRDLASRVRVNRELTSHESTYTEMLAEHFSGVDNQVFTAADASEGHLKGVRGDPLSLMIDIREADVPYLMRVCIDLSIFAGCWYLVRCRPGQPVDIVKNEDTVAWPDPVVLAFDIETTKLPLKFPDPSSDQIMMISYMLDGAGYLLCNREILSEDIADFEFTPRPEFPGQFTVRNLSTELDVITSFFEHIQRVKPNVIVTYNGDMFDWPFVETRAAHYGLSMSEEIAFSRHKGSIGPGRDGSIGEYLSRPAVHIDCLCWVKRDSYLPVGARGLKAVAKAKLRYDPVQVDPEMMCRMARESPHELANYSVSDAVATYYLYMKYVHPFVFALCTILPLNPDDVLRKGSGTLCEALLMVQAYAANVIFPHKQNAGGGGDASSLLLKGSASDHQFTEDGKLIDSETYVGGHVEALEAGVFRADIPVRFRLVPTALEALRKDVQRCLKKTLQTEVGAEDEDALDSLIPPENFMKVCKEVEESLARLAATPNRIECPIIYHLDVGAMYPNIILTNRLQPSAVDSNSTARCSDCHFYKPGVSCQRFMPWTWRAELWTASRPEVYRVQAQLTHERFPTRVAETGGGGGSNGRPKMELKAFHELSREEQASVEKKRLTDFCRRAYKRLHTTRTEERVAMVCQRENSFYVDTVRAFRDRRYKFKGLTKVWKCRSDEAAANMDAGRGDSAAVKEANAMLVLYDSLQLAHKCILNSFYGYVMRRGARWYSMEMAGIVCHTGANIITRARELIEQVGRALELDTDGIWCIFPASFPQNLEFKTTSAGGGKRISISYPGAILNILVQDLFTNDQYHELIDPATMTYRVRSENSIFFEVDGPYKAMVLPAAKEEGKRLKKRYAVFNFDGSLAELKGFEIKRNGELQLIKIFQSSVFEAFLRGRNLTEVYAAAASVADHWLDVLYSRGVDMPDSELFDLISENRSMSRRLEDYGSQKSTSISTARRMAEFLGEQIVKDAGLSCRFVIAKQPEGAPVTDRAIPMTIFQAEPSVRRYYLRKWLKDPGLDEDTDIRDILDWSYYIERLSSTVQKIITIPAAIQQVPNPVPRVNHPDWLLRRLADKMDTCKQRKLTDMFQPAPGPTTADIEDLSPSGSGSGREAPVVLVRKHTDSSRPSLKRGRLPSTSEDQHTQPKPWRDQLGQAPRLADATNRELLTAWLAFHMKKWQLQAERRRWLARHRIGPDEVGPGGGVGGYVDVGGGRMSKRQRGMALYLSQTRWVLQTCVWQIIELAPEPHQPGRFIAWILLESPETGLPPALHSVTVTVPRRFFVNLRAPKPNDSGPLYRKVAGGSGGGSAEASDGAGAGSSSYLLPRSHPVYHLYEYSVPEEVFSAHASDLTADLARPDIEGVYELHVPPLFRAMMRLGCLCTVDRQTQQRQQQEESTGAATTVFHLDQLRFCSLAQHPYLAGKSSLRHLFLFHYQQPLARAVGRKEQQNRQLYLLVVPWTALAYVCVVDNSRVNQLPADLSAVYQRQRARLVPSDSTRSTSVSSAPASLRFETRVEADAASGRRLIQRWLTSVRQQGTRGQPGDSLEEAGSSSSAPIIVLLHAPSQLGSDLTEQQTETTAPWALGESVVGRRRGLQLGALNDFPVVPLGGVLDESEQGNYPGGGGGSDPDRAAVTDAYSLLDWQQKAVKRGLRFFIQSEARFERQLNLARYLHVPVANLPVPEVVPPVSVCDTSVGTAAPEEEEEPTPAASCLTAVELGCDLFYARHLAKQNHVLWCSPTGCPDLGGRETDDRRLLLEMEESGVTEINRPGCYPHVCVEVELSNLAVNTMLVANRIPELEGATLLSFDRLSANDRSLEEQLNRGVNLGANITSYDETAACSAAFRVLRNMVTAWVRDVTDYQNPLADEQIIYFYQWLRSPHTLLYDPALRRSVQKLMKKVFLKLVDELSHLHIEVVYASFSRLIVNTRRLELPEALARVDHFSRLLRCSRATASSATAALFSHLDFQYVASWRQLFWLDSANFAGVKASINSLVDGKDVEWGESDPTSGDSLSDSENSEPNRQIRESSQLPEPEIDMNWHLSRYLPETRGLRGKFQTILAGYISAVYSAIRTEHRRLRGLMASTSTDSEPATGGASLTSPLQSDAALSPGVVEFAEHLLRDQLAPELYTLVQRLHRKAAWLESGLLQPPEGQKTTTKKTWASVLLHRSHIVTAYLAEKVHPPTGADVEKENAGPGDLGLQSLRMPLLPPHPAIESLNFRPLLDFVKSICEILSLDSTLKRPVTGLRRDLFRLIGVGEFSPEATWITPYLARDDPLLVSDNQPESAVAGRATASTSTARSLLIHLAEVACPVCNFTRDIDVCRDPYLAQLLDGPEACWAWLCPHCRTVYPRGRLEDALVQQVEQLVLQHCLQDLQCPKCITGGGIQETYLARGGSTGHCSECSTQLSLTVPTGQALVRRLATYFHVGQQFGFAHLEQTAHWLLNSLPGASV